MLPIRPTSRFRKDLKKALAQGCDLTELEEVLQTLAIPRPLPPEYRDHRLKGKWHDFRECHIQPDWLLIYIIAEFELRPARLGNHSALFE